LKSSELRHLVELPHLESLEIGDCLEWTEASDYEVVGQLSHLKHLRMEQGPLSGVVQHLEHSLKEIHHLQHLELVNFHVDLPIGSMNLNSLKRLLIIPCYSDVNIIFLSLLIFANSFRVSYSWIYSLCRI
jgi:hypothetical protein